MAYFLRQEKKKKGIYLQMYETYWDKEKKQPRSKSIQAFGYVNDLISDEIPDPVAYYKEYVIQKNAERTTSLAEATRPRAFTAPAEINIGHFLLHSLLTELNVKETIDILASQMRFQFSVYDMIAQLIYARIICPCSKSKTVSSVFPHLYNNVPISEDQVYDGCSFIGASYKNILSSSITVMNSTIKETLAMSFLIVLIITLKSIFRLMTGKRDLPKKINMIRSSVRLSFWILTWFL